MSVKSIINGLIVNEGEIFEGSVKICNDRIVEIARLGAPFVSEGEVIDIAGGFLLPGVIDEHVHFREPGMTHKADIYSESRAAAAGGVTSFFDMPNTVPPTVTVEQLNHKCLLAAKSSMVNYAFYIGATNDNVAELQAADPGSVAAIKLFMGASTGNMLVEREEALHTVFDIAHRKNLPIVAHCEDTALMAANSNRVKQTVGEGAGVEYHSIIRDGEVCLVSTRKAISLAEETGARLLVAHVSTPEEVDEICGSSADVKAEICVAYLCFNTDDYATLGGRIKCNPAIKDPKSQKGLLAALEGEKVFSIATDHAPHRKEDKEGGAFKAASGMPSIQFSLPLMLQFTEGGVLSIDRVVELMCHNPARFFGVKERGFIRKGYKADLVVVRRDDISRVVSDEEVVSKCGWTPYVGRELNWRVDLTICNGNIIYSGSKGFVAPDYRGEAIVFCHDNNTEV